MKPITARDLLFLFVFALTVTLLTYKGVSMYMQTPVDKGTITVYGSKTCPWCVKQESYLKNQGIPYDFVDCRTGECPEFVTGYPTLVVNGKVMSGYNEI